MQKGEKLLHVAYAIAIASLILSVAENIVKYLHFDEITKHIFLGLLGVILIVLGLFKFKKGLSFGLVLGGMRSMQAILWRFFNKVTDLHRFFLAFLILIIIVYALYRLYNQEQGKKHGKN